VQLRDQKYVQFLAATDTPRIEQNADIMARYKDSLRKLYYDPRRHKTYLEQLGVTFPTLTKPGG
jgi:aminobenzoyl-glutamate utilization protein B